MEKPKKDKSRLIPLLKELRLPAFRESYEELARNAERDSQGYESFLLALVERECDDRQRRRFKRFLRESRLPLEKTMESFDMKRLPSTIHYKVKSLMDGSFADRRENVLAFGNPGSGKTHLLSAIGHEMVRQGRRTYFTKCSLLVQKLLTAKRDLKLERILRQLSKYQAIIVDDIGYVQQNREEMEVLFN